MGYSTPLSTISVSARKFYRHAHPAVPLRSWCGIERWESVPGIGHVAGIVRKNRVHHGGHELMCYDLVLLPGTLLHKCLRKERSIYGLGYDGGGSITGYRGSARTH